MTAPHTASAEAIAIVGRGCLLPQAESLEQYWRMIAQGHCAQAPLTDERLDRDLLYHAEKGRLGSTYADFACTVRYPNLRSPQCRLPQSLKRHPEQAYATLADIAFAAIDDAGLDPLDLPSHRAGVFVGHTRASGLAGDATFACYVAEVASLLASLPAWGAALGDRLQAVGQQLVQEVRTAYHRSEMAPGGAGQSARSLAASLRVDGPQMAFNAACASSSQALVQAIRALQRGRCDFALAAGASYCHTDTLVLFSKAQSLSASGTRPLAADADGLVVGEGYVTLLLCRLSDAIRQQLPIHGIVQGVGQSSDGKGKSLWAPRKQGQVLAVRRAYADSDAYRQVGYIEAHATSTQVGDATEMQALVECFQEHLLPGCRIPVGSVKANIGHTLETAGLASVLKCLLAMQHETIPAMPHVDQPNLKIDWERVPLELPRENRPWRPITDGHSASNGWTAAINAFGIGGLNTHIVIRRPRHTPKRSVASRFHSGPGASAQNPVRISTPPARSAVAVIGVGAILPGASNVQDFVELIHSGESALSPVPANRWNPEAYPTQQPGPWNVRSRLGGVVAGYQFDWKRHRVPPKQVAHASPLQFMILDAVEQAVQLAGVDWSDSQRRRCGVVVGTSFGGEFSNQLQVGLRLPELRQRLTRLLSDAGVSAARQAELLDGFTDEVLQRMPALLDETGSFTSSSLASRISKNLDLMGGAVAVDSGNTSFGSGMTCCIDQLASGDNDLMICVGAQQDLGPSRYSGLTRLGLLGDDTGTEGMFPGEGAVAFLLQRLTDARQAGHPVLGVIDSIGFGFNPQSLPRAIFAAVSAAQAGSYEGVNSAMCPSDIEHSVVGSDDVEQQLEAALAWCLRSGNESQPRPRMHNVSRQVGHLAGGAMAVSLLATLARLQPHELGSKNHHCAGAAQPFHHWVVGGSQSEGIQVIQLRS